MEQSFIAPERGGLIVRQILAVVTGIFVWIVRPWRSVNYFDLLTPTVAIWVQL